MCNFTLIMSPYTSSGRISLTTPMEVQEKQCTDGSTLPCRNFMTVSECGHNAAYYNKKKKGQCMTQIQNELNSGYTIGQNMRYICITAEIHGWYIISDSRQCPMVSQSHFTDACTCTWTLNTWCDGHWGQEGSIQFFTTTSIVNKLGCPNIDWGAPTLTGSEIHKTWLCVGLEACNTKGIAAGEC